MIELIVGVAAVFTVALCVGWLLRPDLRARLERPKHGFQARLRRYDRSLP